MMVPRKPPPGEDSVKYHRRASDPHSPDEPGVPHQRATDSSFKARVKEWGSIVAAASAIMTLAVFVFVSFGGQYVLPNDRVSKNEARIERQDERITALEKKINLIGPGLIDTIIKMNRSTDQKLDMLLVSKCTETTVRPPRLRALCDTLANEIPFRSR